MTDLEREAYTHAVADMLVAPDDHTRAAIAKRTAALTGRSLQTVYARLRQLGWQSGRKARADRGTSAVAVADLEPVSEMLAAARNKRGQPNLPGREAHRICQEQGMAAGTVSYGHMLRLLHRSGLGLRHMRAPEAAIPRVTDHPNHVWFFDISIAIQWYFRDEATGKKLDAYSDGDARFYEGKLHNFRKINKIIHRYVVTDHYTGAYYVRYYYSAGERAEDVVDFLWHAMSDKGALAQAWPFRGLPRRLVMDQGSANKSALVRNLLEELDIIPMYHKPKNAKASGSVETRHNHWQRSFEGRLRARKVPVQDLDELNGLAAKSAAVMNATRPHTRTKKPPMEVWVAIAPEQLREAPARAIVFQLATTSSRTATLTAELYLRAHPRKWQVAGEHVHAGQKVRFRLSPFCDVGIRVWDEFDRELAATPIDLDGVGFPTTGHFHKFDDAEHKGATAPTTPAQALAREVLGGEREVDLPVFSNLDQLLARQAYLSQPGIAWEARATAIAAEPVIASLTARQEIVRRLERPLSATEGAWWREAIGAGVTESRLDELYATFTHEGTATALAR